MKFVELGIDGRSETDRGGPVGKPTELALTAIVLLLASVSDVVGNCETAKRNNQGENKTHFSKHIHASILLRTRTTGCELLAAATAFSFCGKQNPALALL